MSTVMPSLPLPEGNVAVTGAASGIGRAVAVACADAGLGVFAFDRNGDRLANLAANADVKTQQLDARDATGVQDFMTSVPELVGVVHSVGITARRGILDTDPATYRQIVETNLTGSWHVVQAAASRLLSDGRAGSIVVITSINAQRPLAHQALYSACKAAVASLVASLATELGPAGIRVNAVAPGAIATSMNPGIENDRDIAERIPLRRVGRPEDVAGPVLFLLSDLAAYVTGATVAVDGGLLQTR